MGAQRIRKQTNAKSETRNSSTPAFKAGKAGAVLALDIYVTVRLCSQLHIPNRGSVIAHKLIYLPKYIKLVAKPSLVIR